MQKHESLLTANDYKKVNHSRLFTADECVVRVALLCGKLMDFKMSCWLCRLLCEHRVRNCG